MPMWAIVLTVIFSGLLALTSSITLLRSFRFATKDDIDEIKGDIARLEKRIDTISERIDRHLEGHP